MYFHHVFGMQSILGGHVGMDSRVHIVRVSCECVRYHSSVSRPDVWLNYGNVFRASLSVHSKLRQTVSDRGLSLSVHSSDRRLAEIHSDLHEDLHRHRACAKTPHSMSL